MITSYNLIKFSLTINSSWWNICNIASLVGISCIELTYVLHSNTASQQMNAAFEAIIILDERIFLKFYENDIQSFSPSLSNPGFSLSLFFLSFLLSFLLSFFFSFFLSIIFLSFSLTFFHSFYLSFFIPIFFFVSFLLSFYYSLSFFFSLSLSLSTSFDCISFFFSSVPYCGVHLVIQRIHLPHWGCRYIIQSHMRYILSCHIKLCHILVVLIHWSSSNIWSRNQLWFNRN